MKNLHREKPTSIPSISLDKIAYEKSIHVLPQMGTLKTNKSCLYLPLSDALHFLSGHPKNFTV